MNVTQELSGPYQQRSPRPQSERFIGRFLVCLLALSALAQAKAQTSAPPAVLLRSELSWTPVYAGDPLRVRVYLSSPLVIEESLERIRLIEEGQAPTNSPPPPSVQLPAEWQSKLNLRLYQLNTNGTREVLLEPAAWVPFLRPQVGLPPGVAQASSVRSREWLVSADAGKLTNGMYVVESSWDGQGLLPPEQLPASGTLTADELRFEVVSPGAVGAGEAQAEHLGRLAFAAYAAGNHVEARRLGTEALNIGSTNTQPDRLETHFLVAQSALALKDYAGAISALDNLTSRLDPASAGEVLEMVRSRSESLTPRLRLFPATPAPGYLQLELETLPDQRYATYESIDLRLWTPVSTNLSLTNWITLPAIPVANESQRFYRSILQP